MRGDGSDLTWDNLWAIAAERDAAEARNVELANKLNDVAAERDSLRGVVQAIADLREYPEPGNEWDQDREWKWGWNACRAAALAAAADAPQPDPLDEDIGDEPEFKWLKDKWFPSGPSPAVLPEGP